MCASALVVLNYNKVNLTLTIIIFLTLTFGFGNIVSLYQNNFNSFLSSPDVGFEENGEFRFSSWDAFAKTDAFWTAEEPDEMMVGLNGRSFSRIIKYDGDLSKIQYLKNKIGYLPLEIGNPEKVAIIGSGGGEEILYSFLAGIKNITAVEINPGTIAATMELAEFTGNIYDDPRVKTIIGDGRSFIRKTDEKYDQIYLALVMTNIGDNVANTLSENYIYTREALADYFAKLKPGGKVSFLFHSPSDLLKMLTTAITYFEKTGIAKEQIPDHFVIVRNQQTAMYPVLMVKSEPFSKTEVDEIYNKIKGRTFQLVHLPGLVEEHSLHMYREGDMTLADMIKGVPINVEPISDDRPFFYNVQKGVPKSLLALVIGTLLLLIIAFLFAVFQNSKRRSKNNFKINFLIFTLLGMAFMFIEITLIQKMSVFLEHPATSFVTIITILLLGAGIGNLIQSKKELFYDFRPVLYLVILGVIELLVINQVIYWEGFAFLGYKIALVSLMLLPLGFFLGIPFPMVLKKLKDNKRQNWVPYFWGINGIGSVLGSGLTMIVSLKYGFNISFIIGVTLYSIIGLLIKKLTKLN